MFTTWTMLTNVLSIGLRGAGVATIPSVFLVLRGGSTFLLLCICTSLLQAATLTIPGTGLFDQSLGTLNSVEILLSPPSATVATTGPHTHVFDPPPFVSINSFTSAPYPNGTSIDFLPITVTTVGNHSHIFTISPFSSSVGTIVFPSVNLTASGAHNHTIDFPSATVFSGQLNLPPTTTNNSSGSHSHTLFVPPFVRTFSGAGLAPFLTGTPIATINPPNTISATVSSHQHVISGGHPALVNGAGTLVGISTTFSSSSGTHTHSLNMLPFDITSTTFYYTPVPEPATLPFMLLAALPLLRRRSR